MEPSHLRHLGCVRLANHRQDRTDTYQIYSPANGAPLRAAKEPDLNRWCASRAATSIHGTNRSPKGPVRHRPEAGTAR
jgi:hypothetical protein